MARRKSITKRRRLLFLDKLEGTGSVVKASIAGEIGRSSWYDLRERDEEFRQEWDDAEALYMDIVEGEAFRRGMIGDVEKKPFLRYDEDGKKYTDTYTVTTKSDRLLELCLKARHPAYKPVKALELSNPDGTMIPRGTSDIDWGNLTDDEVEQLVDLQRKLHAIDSKG